MTGKRGVVYLERTEDYELFIKNLLISLFVRPIILGTKDQDDIELGTNKTISITVN